MFRFPRGTNHMDIPVLAPRFVVKIGMFIRKYNTTGFLCWFTAMLLLHRNFKRENQHAVPDLLFVKII